MKKIIGLALSLILLSACAKNVTNTNTNKNINNTNNKMDASQDKELKNNNNRNNKTDNINNESVSDKNLTKDVNVNLTKEDAFKKFNDLHPNTNINEFSFSKDLYKKLAKYEIEAYDQEREYEVEINATDSSIIRDKSKKEKISSTAIILADMLGGIDDLVNKSIAQAGQDYLLKDYSLYFDDGISKFDVELENSQGKEAEFTYNLESGELLEKDLSE